jgi:hypothetical protein
MVLSHVTKVFAAKDAKLWPLTADPAGGSPTYGTGVDVPGLKTVTIGGDINTAELRGDNTSLDKQSTMGGVTVAMEFAKLSLDVLSAVLSAATVDSGTTPNQKSIWTLLGTSTFNYVGITAQAVGADTITGDVQFSLYKCMLSSFPEMGLEEEDYKTSSIEFGAIPLLANGKWLGTTLNETTAALAAPA